MKLGLKIRNFTREKNGSERVRADHEIMREERTDILAYKMDFGETERTSRKRGSVKDFHTQRTVVAQMTQTV